MLQNKADRRKGLMAINLKKEQETTLARPRMKYGLLASVMFLSMDLIYGRKTTYPKVKFLEILARIPYQAWEIKQYCYYLFREREKTKEGRRYN